MSGFFRGPAIQFDRGIYPRCLGLSKDAFKQYIHECSYINKGSGMQFSNQRAAKNCLGFSEEKYDAVKKELVENHFVLRYCKKKEDGEKPANKKSKRKTWGCSNPPLLKLSEVDGSSEGWFFSPQCEPQSGLSAMFHHGETPFGFIRIPSEFARTVDLTGGGAPSFLSKMSPDEIDVYLNLLWQNRESCFGINPNYLRYELNPSLSRYLESGIYSLDYYLHPGPGDELCIDPTLQYRTQMPREQLSKIIDSLVDTYGLFEWQFWIASYTTYRELRRRKVSSSVKLRQFFDSQAIIDSRIFSCHLECLMSEDNNLVLIAQLRSRLALNPKFEAVIKKNCHWLSLFK